MPGSAEVVEYTSTRKHTAAGNDDSWSSAAGEVFRVGSACHEVDPGANRFNLLLVQTMGQMKAAIDVGHIGGHGAIDMDGDRR